MLTVYDWFMGLDKVSFCVYDWQEKMSEGACLMLLGNKTDLASADRREVTGAQGRRLAEVKNDLLIISVICLSQCLYKDFDVVCVDSSTRLSSMNAVLRVDTRWKRP